MRNIKKLATYRESDRQNIIDIWKFLNTKKKPQDLDLALNRLTNNPFWATRRIAAAVLLNFHINDKAWRTLAVGVLAPDDRVNASCAIALSSLASKKARKVNWRPAQSSLEKLFQGTNIFAYPNFCKVLLATEIEPKLGRNIVKSSPALFSEFLNCRSEYLHTTTHRLIAHIAERAETTDPDSLRNWLIEFNKN